MTHPVAPEVHAMTGTAALPRHNGELAFDAPWEGRVFGMAIGVVETKDKAALALLREHPIQKRRADIARVNASGRTWCEAYRDGHPKASRGIYW